MTQRRAIGPQKKIRPTEDRDVLRREFYAAVDEGRLSLRETVRQFRFMLKMNQHDFAKFIGLTPRILIAFEQGHGNSTLLTLSKMLKGSGLELRITRKRRSPTNN